jgi:5-methyltetrahydrofolate--homocysteine methyltransferase
MLSGITDAICQGNQYDIAELVTRSLDSGSGAQEDLEAMLAGLQTCGERFERGEYFLPELMAAADAFKAGMAVLEPRLRGSQREYLGTVVLGTVSGDVHDIGKNLVGFMLESSGLRVIDLGVDVPAEEFVRAVREHRADCLGLSALLTTTMLGMPKVMEDLGKAGLRQAVKVVVGGAPVSKRFADSIGADGYASDAPSAVKLVKGLLANPTAG